MSDRLLENAHFEIFGDDSPVDKMVGFVKGINANMTVVDTRNKRGIAGI